MSQPYDPGSPDPIGDDRVRHLVDEARQSLERSLSDVLSQVEQDEVAVRRTAAVERFDQSVEDRIAVAEQTLRREAAEAGDGIRADLEARIDAVLDTERRRLAVEAEERHRRLASMLEKRLLDVEERVRLAEFHLQQADALVERGVRVEERMREAAGAEERAADRIAEAERRIAGLLDQPS